MSDEVEAGRGDQTNHDGLAAMAALALTVLFIVAIIAFAIA